MNLDGIVNQILYILGVLLFLPWQNVKLFVAACRASDAEYAFKKYGKLCHLLSIFPSVPTARYWAF